MKERMYKIAIIFLIFIFFITSLGMTAIALQESTESLEGQVNEYDPNYMIPTEHIGEDVEIYIEPTPDTEPVLQREPEYDQTEDRYWWEDDDISAEDTIPEDPNQ